MFPLETKYKLEKKKKEERTVNFRSSNSSSILTCKRGMRPLDFTNTRQTREFFSLSVDRTSIFRGICRARVSISHTVAWKPGVLITRGKGGNKDRGTKVRRQNDVTV